MNFRQSKTNRYLKPYQVKYIKDNAAQLTLFQMAGAIGCSYVTVWAYCKKLKVVPNKAIFQATPPVIPPCIETDETVDLVKIIETGTKYDNKSREERINELLNT